MATGAAAACTTSVTVDGHAVALHGRLGVGDATDVRLALADAVAHGDGPLVLDLSLLTGLDATGLGVLVGAHRRAGRAGRVLVLRDVQPEVHRLLLLTRLDRVLRTERSCAAA